MRMPPEGRPFVPPPPLCPAGQQGSIPDLEAVSFQMTVDSGAGRPTDVGGEFFVIDQNEEGELVDFVETATMQLPSDPFLLQRLLESTYAKTESGAWGRNLDHTESPFVDTVRMRFCERVAKCPGVIDGECWALGRTAAKEVIEKALKEGDR